ncbi:hypothetical protein ES703_53626 [subsurface metagenome]
MNLFPLHSVGDIVSLKNIAPSQWTCFFSDYYFTGRDFFIQIQRVEGAFFNFFYRKKLFNTALFYESCVSLLQFVNWRLKDARISWIKVR